MTNLIWFKKLLWENLNPENHQIPISWQIHKKTFYNPFQYPQSTSFIVSIKYQWWWYKIIELSYKLIAYIYSITNLLD